MTIRKTILSISIAAILDLAAADAMAQQAAAAATPAAESATELEEIVVTGIRATGELALELKRGAPIHQEVVSAEDIGKLPYKNIADSLQHVPGVTISAASANEGAFDENDRVSMRGTSPSLTQTLINGHNIATGDWFVLNQTGTVGRSVSFSLLPSELVDRVVAYKTSQAKLVEGGAVGSVDIITRSPLKFTDDLTVMASLGTVYADLPDEFSPQISALVGWKNEAGNFGVVLQAFNEERALRRDGQELLGYNPIRATDAAGIAHPDLVGVYYPKLVGSALFEQERKRVGGYLAMEFQPTDDVDLQLTAFTSTMEADNYNRNYMLWGEAIVQRGAVPSGGYEVRDNTLVQADFAADPTRQYGIYDQISRPNSESSTYFVTLDGSWRASDLLTLTAQIGTSEGHGKTPTQDVAEWDVGKGTGAGWELNGVGAANWNLGTADTSQPGTPLTDMGLDWIFGLQDIDVVDQEDWMQFDGEFQLDGDWLTSVDFGARYASHSRDLDKVTAQGPGCIDSSGNVVPFDWSQQFYCPAGTTSPFDPVNWPQGYKNYPGDYASGIGGQFPRDIWYYSEGQLREFNELTNRDPVSRFHYPSAYGLDEDSIAAYGQLNFRNGAWSGNVGLRYVQTKEDVTNYVSTTPADPDANTTSAFGPFRKVRTDNTYNHFLPSANLNFEVTEDVLLRFAASQTMSRPDYSALAGSVSLIPPAVVGGTGSGTGGNPNLEPIVSTNFDVAAEWYFAAGALLSASVFYMDLDEYVQLGHRTESFFTIDNVYPEGAYVEYDLVVPVNSNASVKGIEVAWQQPFGDYFGASANFTYSSGDADDSDGDGKDDPVLGLSKTVYNVGGYFENRLFSARLNYNWRSSFYSGLDRASAFFQDDVGYLSATLGWKINENFSLALDGMNLNDPKVQYYAESKQRPRSIYENGSQYYLNLRMKF